jgi:hypothetical protein
MAIEQIIFLLALIIPFVQLLLRRRREAASRGVEPPADSPALEPPRVDWRHAPEPPPPPPPAPGRAGPRVRPARAALVPVNQQPAARRHLREVAPRDRRALREAMLLAEIVGPPRSLQRSDSWRS